VLSPPDMTPLGSSLALPNQQLDSITHPISRMDWIFCAACDGIVPARSS